MLLIILRQIENAAVIISVLGNEITEPFAVEFVCVCVMHNYSALFTMGRGSSLPPF